jgi:hypothetical protein
VCSPGNRAASLDLCPICAAAAKPPPSTSSERRHRLMTHKYRGSK